MKRADYENRFFAFIVDFSICFASAIGWTIYGSSLVDFSSIALFIIFDYFSVLVALLFISYHVFFYLVFKGITIGGVIFNVRIIDVNGVENKRLSLTKALLRGILLSLIPLAVINIPFMLFRKDQATLYDQLVDTTSVPIRD